MLPELGSSTECGEGTAVYPLRNFIGEWTGFAKMINPKLDFERAKPLAPKKIKNSSTFKIIENRNCEEYEVTINYLSPVRRKTVRQVRFIGKHLGNGYFSMSVKGQVKGYLKQIDDEGNTFHAHFKAPHPKNSEIETECDEMINLVANGKEIVRTIQCFSVNSKVSEEANGDLSQIRIVREKRR